MVAHCPTPLTEASSAADESGCQQRDPELMSSIEKVNSKWTCSLYMYFSCVVHVYSMCYGFAQDIWGLAVICAHCK